jgi:1,4-alpha-glucan branching enzyme
MGAYPSAGGVTFRVWAPFAQSVSVVGDFNAWNITANPLASEGSNGYWSAEVAGVGVGHQYKYYIVNGTGFRRNDPYAREIDSSTWPPNSVVHPFDYQWSDWQFRMPAWNELVIYEIHVGTFAGQVGPGGFDGAKARLPYLRDLGINAIEVMPPGEFTTGTSMGYNPAYIYAIESSFGGINAFKSFVEAAHNHGIAVILDVVYNHFGPQGASAGDEGLWQFDGWSQDGYGGIYFYNDERARTDWGARPDYGREEVRWYLQENALTWLDHRHIDGLRWDSTSNIRNVNGNEDPAHDIPEGWGFMQWTNDEIDRLSGSKISIAEDLKGNEWITKDTGAGGAGFDAQWDASFTGAIREALTADKDDYRRMWAVADAIKRSFNGEAFQRVIYTESHDECACGNNKVRLTEAIARGDATNRYAQKRSTLGAGIVLTVPGIPMLFQGQEFLEWGCWSDQKPLDWSKTNTFGGIVSLYRDLIRLRRNWFNSTRGLRGRHANVYHSNDADKVLAFHRWDGGGPGDDVVVVLNMADRAYESYTIGFPREGLWKVRFNSDWNGYSPDFGNHPSYDTLAQAQGRDGMPYSGSVGIGPYTIIIFSQDG